jgi:[ribosomal protein S18]-alanine N-acetyltransferase
MPTVPGARIHLRDMTPADIRRVRRIESAAYEDAWPARIFETELENGFAQYRVAVEQADDLQPRSWFANARRILFGRSRERIVGFMGVWYMVDQLHLVTIAVAPEAQGRGIGQRLMLECFDLAEHAELGEVVLEVRVTNTPARRLYEYFGFRQAGILKGYYKDNNEDAAVMLSGPLASNVASREQIRAQLHEAHPGLFVD